MALDDVTFNQGGMAGLEFFRNTVPALNLRELTRAHIFLFNLETIRL
jgi:hypothetical protein